MTLLSNNVNTPITGSRVPPFHILGFTATLDETTPDSLLVLSAGTCADSTDNIDMTIESTTTLNIATTGKNGLDTGAAGNNLFYYVYVIGDSSGFNAPAGLMSLSFTAPALPYGYDSFRAVDIKVTDGTADFLPSYTLGQYGPRKFVFDAPVLVLDGEGSATFATVDLTETVAPVLTPMVQFTVSITPETGEPGDAITLIPTDSASSAYAVFSGSVEDVAEVGDIECIAAVNSGAAEIDYKTTDVDDVASLWVKSFTYCV